jgi:hypothetical protein
MKSFTEHLEWQEVKRLSRHAATLMAELDVDVEEYLSEAVESYDSETLEEGLWDTIKDKFKATKWGGAVAGAVAAGKDQAGLPKFKFDKALAGLQALADAIPVKVRGVSGQKELKHWLGKIVSDLQKQKPAIDAVGVKPTEMGGFTAKDQAAHKASNAPKTTSTQADVAQPAGMPNPIHAGAGITPDGKAIVDPALAGESTQVVETAEYDPSKGSWYVDDDGKVIPNIPPEDDKNGFFGSW